MKPVNVIGMGLSPRDLTDAHLALIREADILAGGRRHLTYFKDTKADQYEITAGLDDLIRTFKRLQRRKSIVVLASGDPLYYGIGQRLVRDLGPDNVVLHPNVTTVAAAFARLKLPWAGVPAVSLHGRENIAPLMESLQQNERVAVFTDPKRHPGWLAGQLQAKDCGEYEICVLERLGTPEERVAWYDLPAAATKRFKDPNLVVIQRRKVVPTEKREPSLGMPDAWFEHERGLITKAEVRAVTLAKLNLKSSHVFWDLGAGSGSVSIEAGLFIKRGKIFAVEQNAARVGQIKRNKKRFGVKNLTVVEAVLPDGLEALPDPDRIFIGGGGRNLSKILRQAGERLAPGGVVVVNTVLMDSIQTACQTLKKMKFKTSIVQLQVQQGRAMPWGERMEAENPVWIVRGEKEKGESSKLKGESSKLKVM